jgi:hypothetical protein
MTRVGQTVKETRVPPTMLVLVRLAIAAEARTTLPIMQQLRTVKKPSPA